MSVCDQIEPLLSGYLDGELTQQDRQRVELHIDDCTRCRAEFEQLRTIQSELGSINHPQPTEQQWSMMMSVSAIRTSRGLGWIIGIAGLAILAWLAISKFVSNESVGTWERIGIGAVAIAGVLIGGSVLIERLRARKTDKYKDVEL